MVPYTSSFIDRSLISMHSDLKSHSRKTVNPVWTFIKGHRSSATESKSGSEDGLILSF